MRTKERRGLLGILGISAPLLTVAATTGVNCGGTPTPVLDGAAPDGSASDGPNGTETSSPPTREAGLDSSLTRDTGTDATLDGTPPAEGGSAPDAAQDSDSTAQDGGIADAQSDSGAVDSSTTSDASPPDEGGDDASSDGAAVVACDTGVLLPGLTVLAAGSRPMLCVVDACNVYWTDQATGGVQRVSKNGGTVSAIATSTAPPGQGIMSEGLAIDATNLFWSEYVDVGLPSGGVPLRTGDVVRTNLASGVSTILWNGTDAPNAVAIDSAFVYVLQNSDLQRVPIDGGASSVLATGPGAYGLTVFRSALYWTAYNGVDQVEVVKLDGGDASTFATGSGRPGASSTAVTQDGTNIYWGDSAPGGVGGSVYRVPLDGGAQVPLLADAGEPLGIAYDADFLYVTTGATGSVLRIAKADGGVVTLASGQGWPYGIAVDDGFVYWVNNNGGANSVMRIAK